MWVIIPRDSFEEMSLCNLRISQKGIKRNLKRREGNENIGKAIEIVPFQNISSSIVSISHNNFSIRKNLGKNPKQLSFFFSS